MSVMGIDGVVVARSGFHGSMNYRSVTVFGRGEPVTGSVHRSALDKFVDASIPGHGAAVRAPTEEELNATAVVRIKLDEMSAKIRGGDPIDADSDEQLDIWASQIPLRKTALSPISATDLKPGIQVPQCTKQFVVQV